jgi:predicted SnoaL-like aldol condensation-catalyzing enzyme
LRICSVQWRKKQLAEELAARMQVRRLEDGRKIILLAVSQHPQLRQDVKRITADGDLVMAHSLIKFSPEDRGTAVVDILRFEDGKIVEHWDVRQPVPEATASGNPFTSPDRS